MNPMNRKKITVVGAGNVGATTALYLAQKELGNVVLLDILDGIPQGKALDMSQTMPVIGSDVVIQGTTQYEDTKDSDLVIITSGFPRKPGMTRDDLLLKNYEIVKTVVENIVKYSPNTFIIVVTNPLDAMAYAAMKVSGFPKNRVMGMAGVLDTARFRTFLAWELGCSVEDVTAFVLGGHGDTMVPLVRYSTMAGVPIEKLMSAEKINAIVERAKNGGAEIVALLKTGSAYYAPAASAVQMAESILKDKKRVLPVCAYLEGQYGVKGNYLGVPVVLGKNGIEKVIELELTADESQKLKKSIDAVYELTTIIDKNR